MIKDQKLETGHSDGFSIERRMTFSDDRYQGRESLINVSGSILKQDIIWDYQERMDERRLRDRRNRGRDDGTMYSKQLRDSSSDYQRENSEAK
jgi:hypothetical protein